MKKCGCPQKYQAPLESAGRGCRHLNVFHSLSCFFRHAESSTYEPLAFMSQVWYIVHVLKSTRANAKGRYLQHEEYLLYFFCHNFRRAENRPRLIDTAAFLQSLNAVWESQRVWPQEESNFQRLSVFLSASSSHHDSAARKVVRASSSFSFPFPPFFFLISLPRSVCLLACLFGGPQPFRLISFPPRGK